MKFTTIQNIWNIKIKIFKTTTDMLYNILKDIGGEILYNVNVSFLGLVDDVAFTEMNRELRLELNNETF